jgi:HAD superfamily hydrolase (TIGR01509 family)
MSLLGNGLAVIFDLDGVVVHSNPVHVESWNRYLEQEGLAVDETFHERMYGKRNDQIFRMIVPEETPDEKIWEMSAAKEALYREMMAEQLEQRLVGGIREFLQSLDGTPIGLATNAELANADFVLDTAGIRKHFRAGVYGKLVEKPKPSPDLYLLAAERIGVPISNCVVFEDSYSGVQAGVTAGARVVGVTTTHDHFPNLDLIIPDFRAPQLKDWLASQRPI